MEKYVLSNMKDKNFSKAVSEIYLLTDYNKLQYPDYYKWFYQKNIPRILNGEGEAIFYLDGFNVVGLSMMKKDELEKKICTLLINEEYRKLGYSKQILEDSFEYLGTDKPLITIPENRLDEFKSIITAYDWMESKIITDYYSPEVIFNQKIKSLK